MGNDSTCARRRIRSRARKTQRADGQEGRGAGGVQDERYRPALSTIIAPPTTAAVSARNMCGPKRNLGQPR